MGTSARGSGQTPPCLRRDWRCRESTCEVLWKSEGCSVVEVSFKQDSVVEKFGKSNVGSEYLKNRELLEGEKFCLRQRQFILYSDFQSRQPRLVTGSLPRALEILVPSVTLPSAQAKFIGLGRTNCGSVMLGTDNTARLHLGCGDAQITYSFDLCDIMLVRITDNMTPDFACLTIEP
jgi:hypothetical protein